MAIVDPDVESCARAIIGMESVCIEWAVAPEMSVRIAAEQIQKLVDSRSGWRDRAALTAHWQKGHLS